jgi:hypothetical protein
MLGNKFYSALGPEYGPVAGKPAMVTRKPFNFVFLDGCNTGKGDFPEAFGIPKVVSGTDIDDGHLHERAFMGWSGTVQFQFDSDHIDWTLKFWSTWMDDPGYDQTVRNAIIAANNYRSSVMSNVPILRWGNPA